MLLASGSSAMLHMLTDCRAMLHMVQNAVQTSIGAVRCCIGLCSALQCCTRRYDTVNLRYSQLQHTFIECSSLLHMLTECGALLHVIECPHMPMRFSAALHWQFKDVCSSALHSIDMCIIGLHPASMHRIALQHTHVLHCTASCPVGVLLIDCSAIRHVLIACSATLQMLV